MKKEVMFKGAKVVGGGFFHTASMSVISAVVWQLDGVSTNTYSSFGAQENLLKHM